MRKTSRIFILLVIVVLLAGATPSAPALAAEGVVRVVLFWMEGCPHCHYVLDEVLPPLQEKYGSRLEIRLIEVVTTADVNQFLQPAASFGIPKEQVGVPFLVIGEHVLIGSERIPAELPGLIEYYLSTGGVDYPDLPALADIAPMITPIATSNLIPTQKIMEAPAIPVVHLLLFWTSDCHACRTVIAQVIPPLKEKYGERLVVHYEDVVTGEDVDHFYQIAAVYDIPKEQADLPMLIIGDHVLIGAEQIPARLPGLVEAYLTSGGAELPDVSSQTEATTTNEPALPERPDGFTLAISVMIINAAASLYSIVAFLRGKSLPPALDRAWLDALFAALVLIGLGIASYLAYVETHVVSAVCGPVGDCNAVQSSPYSRLFGVLPVGVLGLIGYLTILAGWFYPRSRLDWAARVAPLAVFGMTFFGVLFSLYLTYLESFVIRAVCAWCLISAVIMTMLLLLSLRPALQALGTYQKSEKETAENQLENILR